MRLLKYVLPLLALAAATGSCNMINPAEEIPTYIQVDSFQVLPSDTGYTAGTTHDIKTVFVLFDGKTIGGFDLPARIPVLAKEEGNLQLIPGVNNTGLFTYQLRYPHYVPFTTRLPARPGETVAVKPFTAYGAASQFVYTEDFESATDFVALEGAGMNGAPAPGTVLDGTRSGVLALGADGARNVVVSNGYFTFTTSVNRNPMLELDYRGDALLRVGLVSTASGRFAPSYVFTAYPAATRTKLYLDIQSAIGSFQSPTGRYNVLLEALPATGQTAGSVVVDNIKVVVN